MPSALENTQLVKLAAAALGFDFAGVATAVFLEEDAHRLERWLAGGMHGGMSYMENYFDLRVDPRKLVPGAKSVITLLLNYYPEEEQQAGAPKISKYAYGNDYHDVIRAKLHELIASLRGKIGDFAGRGFVDSAPVLERAWAQKSGLGWIGKNGNLINKQRGSFFFLATLITDLDLVPDNPYAKDYCGSCTRCIDACPTDAILPDKVVNGSKCISYFTIELKENLIPQQVEGQFDNWAFGCDTCQDVCPWNRFSSPHQNASLKPIPQVLSFTEEDWEDLTEESFKIIFKNSPLKRTKYAGIRRNLNFIKR